MTTLRILIAAVLAITGHAGASVLVAVLLFAAGAIRALLPVLPQLTAAGLLVTIAVTGYLAFRSVRSWPHMMAVAR